MVPPTSSSHPLRRRLIISAAVLFALFLFCVLLSGSFLFRQAASMLCARQGFQLELRGGSFRPIGLFYYSRWTLFRQDKIILQGEDLRGSYFLFPGNGFRFRLLGGELQSGPSFAGLFPAHHEKIPDIELRRFSLFSRGDCLDPDDLLRGMHADLDMEIRSISLESSDLCRKVYDNTGVRLDRYLKFESGRLQIHQRGPRLNIHSSNPLTGPYQILKLDGEAVLDTQNINLSLTFGLQPRLVRKMQHRNFFKYLIPQTWDRKSPVFLPAPVILTGTIQHPRIDVGKIFSRPPAGDSPQRVRLQLKKDPGSRKYRLQIPRNRTEQEQKS